MAESLETDFQLLLSCPRGLRPSQVLVTLNQSYDRVPHPDESLESSISEIWNGRIETNPKLFNGRKFRYSGYSLHEESGSTDSLHVCLHLGLTDYKTFVGTNLNPLWENFLVSCEDDAIRCQHTASPLGNGAIVETCDKKIVMLRRSDVVGEFPGYFVFPGGHPEPEHANVDDFGSISKEMFDSITREIVEEVGLPHTSLGTPLFIGLSRRLANVRPTAFFFVKCSLGSDEVHRLYYNAEDAYESTQLFTVSLEDIEKLNSKIPGCHNGGFALYKLMVQSLKEETKHY